jgi:hypothetical protein
MKFLTPFLLFPFVAQAEYRAFELVIINKVSGTERIVLSSLDPDQYRGYYPLDQNENISYRDTWMCKGNTGNKPICAKPPRPEKPSVGPDPKSKKP